jgi:DNA-binding protein YbaB
MSTETHPQVAEALEQLQKFSSALEEQMRTTNNESYTATDEAESVEVTINGNRLLTGMNIEQGLMRLGPETVSQRINEALRNAQAAATEGLEAQRGALVASLVDIAGSLQNSVGLSR